MRGDCPSPKMLLTLRAPVLRMVRSRNASIVASEKWVVPQPSVRPSSRHASVVGSPSGASTVSFRRLYWLATAL
jgi:hypothetical protein